MENNFCRRRAIYAKALIETNPYLQNKEKRDEMIASSVLTSSKIEAKRRGRPPHKDNK